MIFVILLTPAPFSADTKNTLIPNLKTPKNIKFRFYSHQHTNSLFCHQAENVDTGTAGGAGDKSQVWVIRNKTKRQIMMQEPPTDKFQPEVGSDYSDDGDDDHEDEEHHHKGEHSDEGHHDLKHVSCLKNIHNESYCEGWKEATCNMKNRQE